MDKAIGARKISTKTAMKGPMKPPPTHWRRRTPPVAGGGLGRPVVGWANVVIAHPFTALEPRSDPHGYVNIRGTRLGCLRKHERVRWWQPSQRSVKSEPQSFRQDRVEGSDGDAARQRRECDRDDRHLR